MTRAQLLLVEDDPTIVRAIVPALEVCGHEVTVAADGASALAQLNNNEWNALVVDLGLPDMDGTAVLRHLRSISLIPAIVISARHSPPDQHACSLAGATGFLSKPFATPDLIEALRVALSGNCTAG